MQQCEILKGLRLENGLKQKELAEKLGIGQSTIVGYEKGLHEATAEILSRYARFFNVSMDYLTGRTDEIGGTLVGSNSPRAWTEQERALGVGTHPTYLSDDEWDWLELGSELRRVKGDEYLNTVKAMLEAVIKAG